MSSDGKKIAVSQQSIIYSPMKMGILIITE